ncbi:glycosyltransferase, partial [Halorubrum sp. SP9]
LDERLVMVGGAGDVDDSVMDRIKRTENIKWKGFVDEDEKLKILSRCTAVVFNGHNEDFGIVPIEANASGKPVVSINDGFPGAFITENENGTLHDGTKNGIKQAIVRTTQTEFSKPLETYVSEFSYMRFSENIRKNIKLYYDSFQTIQR